MSFRFLSDRRRERRGGGGADATGRPAGEAADGRRAAAAARHAVGRAARTRRADGVDEQYSDATLVAGRAPAGPALSTAAATGTARAAALALPLSLVLSSAFGSFRQQQQKKRTAIHCPVFFCADGVSVGAARHAEDAGDAAADARPAGRRRRLDRVDGHRHAAPRVPARPARARHRHFESGRNCLVDAMPPAAAPGSPWPPSQSMTSFGISDHVPVIAYRWFTFYSVALDNYTNEIQEKCDQL